MRGNKDRREERREKTISQHTDDIDSLSLSYTHTQLLICLLTHTYIHTCNYTCMQTHMLIHARTLWTDKNQCDYAVFKDTENSAHTHPQLNSDGGKKQKIPSQQPVCSV